MKIDLFVNAKLLRIHCHTRKLAFSNKEGQLLLIRQSRDQQKVTVSFSSSFPYQMSDFGWRKLGHVG